MALTTDVPRDVQRDVQPDSDEEPPSTPAAVRLPGRIRLGVLVVSLPVAAFMVLCLMYNAPPSAASSRLQERAAAAMQPYFWQDWQLFAPTPGAVNNLVLLQTRIRRPSGELVETKPVEVEDAIDRMPRDFPLNPSKMPGIFLAFNAFAERYAQAATRIDKLPADQRAAAHQELDRLYANNFQELQRFMSTRAATLYPGQDVMALRVTFAQRPIVPFSQRYLRPGPPGPVKTMLVTSWMTYARGVAR